MDYVSLILLLSVVTLLYINVRMWFKISELRKVFCDFMECYILDNHPELLDQAIKKMSERLKDKDE